jgi:hypothetical protein
MAKKQTSKQLSEETLKWIESHPQLIGHLERLQQLSEDKQGDLKSLEQAEMAVIEEIDRLGGEALKQWMQGREKELSEHKATETGVRRHSKKN